MAKELIFENRAWEEAEHPRYVNELLKISKNEERVFEISYRYIERKYFIETYETRISLGIVGIEPSYLMLRAGFEPEGSTLCLLPLVWIISWLQPLSS